MARSLDNPRAWPTPPTGHHRGWRYRIDVSAIWAEFSDDVEMSHFNDDVFRAHRDAIVAILKRAPDYPSDDQRAHPDFGWHTPQGAFYEIVDEIAIADDADEFNAAWEGLYDWADERRVWIATT